MLKITDLNGDIEDLELDSAVIVGEIEHEEGKNEIVTFLHEATGHLHQIAFSEVRKLLIERCEKAEMPEQMIEELLKRHKDFSQIQKEDEKSETFH